jgi:serine/threonine kinase 38
MIYKN